MWLCVVALGLSFAATPAEAEKKRNPAQKSVEESIPDPANGEPLTLVIALNEQTIDIYRGTSLIKSSKVSSGTRGYATMAGVFSILEKQRHHHTNMYSNAPMPWMQRLTRSGTALHGGVLPGYPASHGCVRLSFSFAPNLFRITNVGEHVVIGNHNVTPTLITHPILFQPRPPLPQSEEASEPIEQSADDLAAPKRTENAPAVDSGIPEAQQLSSAPLRILVTRRTQR